MSEYASGPPPDSVTPFPSGSASPPAMLSDRRAPWSFRDLILFILFAILALVVLSFLSFATFAAFGPVFGWRTSATAMSRNVFLALGAQFVFYVFIFIYIYVLVVRRYHFNFWRGIQWGPVGSRQVLHFVAGGVLMTVAVQLAPTLLPDKTNFPLEHLFSSPGSAYATAVFAVVIAPFMEELVFRGFMFSVFEIRISLPVAIVVTAILFAGMHAYEYKGAWNHLLLIFVVGLILSLTRGLTHKLAPSVILHTTYNACLMIGLFVATSHFRVIQSLLVALQR
ncbi:MAG TPA: type II CAAX endopeptidase family protein [Terriglobia bacterium]|nr:type II CAAX endopeptidase family protein [Terriglobia bacterium]